MDVWQFSLVTMAMNTNSENFLEQLRWADTVGKFKYMEATILIYSPSPKCPKNFFFYLYAPALFHVNDSFDFASRCS